METQRRRGQISPAAAAAREAVRRQRGAAQGNGAGNGAARARAGKRVPGPVQPSWGPLEQSDVVESQPERKPGLDTAWKVKAAQAVLLGLVVLGALSGPVALAIAARNGTPVVTEAAQASSTGPEGFAELYVTTYLNQGDERNTEALRVFYPDAASALASTGARAGHFYVTRTATVNAVELQPNYWSVTVVAEVMERMPATTLDAGGADSEGEGEATPTSQATPPTSRAGEGEAGESTPASIVSTNYFIVSVFKDGNRYVATSLPSLIPRPLPARSPELAQKNLAKPSPDDPVAAAVQGFLSAYLAGRGELDRYTHPESGLGRRVEPPPFVEVTLRRITETQTSSNTVTVLAEAHGVNVAGHSSVLHYSLEMINENAQWEVRGHRRVPPVNQAATPVAPATQG